MKIVVTGANGQVTRALQAAAESEGVQVLTLSRPLFDLSDARNSVALLRDIRPDVVVSAAAYTNVDQAELHVEEASQINTTGPKRLAEACAQLDLPIIHLSTDYVFDGTKPTPYHEGDETRPIGVYGATKLAGEKAVASANPCHVILRTSWVFSPDGSNFLTSMLRIAGSNDRIRVVSDQLGCPSFADDIAVSIIKISRIIAANTHGEQCYGIFHMAGTGDTSWSGFAKSIFVLAAKCGLPTAAIEQIETREYPTRAQRPANSRLDCNKLHDVYGIVMPHWFEALSRCVNKIAASSKSKGNIL